MGSRKYEYDCWSSFLLGCALAARSLCVPKSPRARLCPAAKTMELGGSISPPNHLFPCFTWLSLVTSPHHTHTHSLSLSFSSGLVKGRCLNHPAIKSTKRKLIHPVLKLPILLSTQFPGQWKAYIYIYEHISHWESEGAFPGDYKPPSKKELRILS